MKNAMKSAVEQSIKVGASQPTPICVDASTENGFLIIDIADEGLGLPVSSQHDVERLFQIGHSSEGKRWDRLDEQQSYAAVRSPLSSLGVGLPVSRIMMQHFGGDLELLHQRTGCTARIRMPLDTSVLEPEIAVERDGSSGL